MVRLFLFSLFISPLLAAELSRVAAEEFVAQQFQARALKQTLAIQEVAEGLQAFEIQSGTKTLRCLMRKFGNAPPGERSLYLSMHGGGGAPAEINDQQWHNQSRLYEPAEGYYVAPRAPTDTWNLWHEPHIDELFDQLISRFIATQGVDSNRVYLMGYSAGGDGVYQLAPRMADRFAAAAMMAGHPNDASPDGLRNLPFMIFMGGKDSAYDRNQIAANWSEQLSSLQRTRGGYDHLVTIYPEHGHWMNREDAAALPWMAQKRRKAWPREVIWAPSSVRSSRFYWLSGKVKGLINGSVVGQTIYLHAPEGQELTLLLSDQLLNLDSPVQVIANNKCLFSGSLAREKGVISQSLDQRLDVSQAATASLSLRF